MKPMITGVKLLVDNREYRLDIVPSPNNYRELNILSKLDSVEVNVYANQRDHCNKYALMKSNDFCICKKLKTKNIHAVFLSKEYSSNITLLDKFDNKYKLSDIIDKTAIMGINNTSDIFENIHIFEVSDEDNYNYVLQFNYMLSSSYIIANW